MADNHEVKLELTNVYLKKSLDEIIKQKGFVKYDIKISPGSKKGDNYAGIVHKICVSGIKENGEEETLHLFSKIPVEMKPENDLGQSEGFIREIMVYDEILKDLKKFEASKLMEDKFTEYAECLATGTVDHQQFLLMEDITKRNFSMFDRTKTLDLSHTQLVMKALGKFHAYSFALRDQKPELFKKYPAELTEVFLKENMLPALVSFMKKIVKSAVDNLEFEGIYLEKWENFHTNFNKILVDCAIGKFAEPYAVITHGDCWNNNMMFKYENEVPTEVCLLDWQICRYASPVLDLVYYIYCCTEKSFRDQHYETLLNIYYETFSSFLKQLGSDPDNLFPYSAFKDQLKKFGKYGVGMSLFLIPLMVASAEDAKDVEELLEDDFNTTDNKDTLLLWKSRMADVFRDAVDLGYI